MGPSFLKHHLASVLLGGGVAVVIGGVSALTFAMVGPLLDLLLAQNSEPQSLAILVGNPLARILSFLGVPAQAGPKELIETFTYLIFIFGTLRTLLIQAHWFGWERLSERMAQGIRAELARGLLWFDPKERSALAEDRVSGLMGRDLRMTREFIVHYYGSFPRELAQVLFYIATLAMLSPKLTGIFVGALLPVAVALKIIGKKLRHRTQKMLHHNASLSEWVQQRLNGLETIKHYGSEDEEAKRFALFNEQLLKTSYAALRTKVLTAPVTELAAISGFVGVLALALRMIDEGQLQGSVLLSFLTTVAILSQSAGKLARYFNSHKQGMQAWGHLEEFLTQCRDHEKKRVSPMAQGTLPEPCVMRWRELGFGYEVGKPLVGPISLDLNKGQFLCICGPSGAGKTTLMRGLLGLVPFQRGEVVIAEEVSCDQILYLPQNLPAPFLSVREILSYPARKGNLPMMAALEEVGMASLVRQWDLGLDTEIGSQAAHLSGGQLQRLYLARILVQKPSMVLLDEATSALDPEIEDLTIQKLQELAHSGALVMAIAHKKAFLRYADEILYIDEHHQHQLGTFDQLREFF